MMRPRDRLFFLLLAVLAGLALPGAAGALSFVMTTDETLLQQAEVVATGRIASVAPDDPSNIATRYVVEVERALKGKPDAATVALVLPGGDPDAASGFLVPGVPRLARGDRVLVFAARTGDGALAPVQLSLGLFVETWSRGFRYYVRGIDRHGDRSDGVNRAYYQPRAADRFEAWIAARAAGADAKVAYLAVDGGAKFTLIRDNGNVPVRWFTFDGGGSVSWTARSDGQAGMVTDEFAQLQQALAAWTNDAGSRINLTYGGTAAAIDTFCDDINSDGNRVLWNDPLGQIAGSFSCSSGGVLAVAGPCFFGPPQNANGTQYNTVFEARLTVQDGAGCFFDGAGGDNGAEVLAHEIGHTLGLGHSCGDSSSPTCVAGSDLDLALMRATARGNRGAVLGADDRAAVAFVYPAPGGGGAAPTITAPASFAATEDTALVFSGVSFTDADSPSITATFSLPAGSGSIVGSSGGGVTVGGTATARTLAGSPANLNTFISGGNLSFQPLANSTASVTLTIQASDNGGNNATPRTPTINLAAVNDPPSVTLPGTIGFTEDLAGTVVPVSFADVDAGGGNLLATFSVPAGTLSATTGAGVTVGGSATARTLAGSLTALNQFLSVGGLSYTGAANATGAVTLTVSINDQGNTGGGGAQSSAGNTTLQITPANDAPSVSAPASIALMAGATAPLTPVSYADPDAPFGGSVVATYAAPSGTFAASSGGGVTVAGGGTGTLTLTGPLASINAFVAGTPVQYTASAAVSGVVPITLTINDQGNVGGTALSGTRVVNATVMAEGSIFVDGFEP